MNFIKKIFISSFVALFVAAPAFADIVSKTNIVAGANVAVTTPTSGTNAGKVVISATDTTYTTGTPTYSGTTMLYDAVGTKTDGTYQQKVAETNLNKVKKADTRDNSVQASDEKYPSMATMYDVVNNALSSYVPTSFESATKHNTVVTVNNDGDVVQNKISTSGTGNMVTGVAVNDGTVTVSKANVQVPVGSATATTYASIWIE